MNEAEQAPGTAARAIAAAVLGHDPGPMTAADSSSHHVYAGPGIVVKVIDAARHRRLDREVALAPHLPAGLTAPLLDSGRYRLGTREFRYACYTRMPGTTPGLDLPGTDDGTARQLAEEAIPRLRELHAWVPAGDAARTLGETLDHGGFTSRAGLFAVIGDLAAADRDGTVPARLLDGLTAIAGHAPARATAAVPVHADCHWGNWLASGPHVTALLDFEWARLGEPADDWFHLTRFSGRHRETVLGIVAEATATAPDALRAAFEVREANYLADDLRLALSRPGAPGPMAADRLHGLEDLITGRSWWRGAR